MKCDDCLNLLEQYVDGEATQREAEQVSAHLITCASCEREIEGLLAEQEAYARYDRELEIPPSMWSAIAARTATERSVIGATSRSGFRQWLASVFAVPRFRLAFSSAIAVLVFTVAVGIVYLRNRASNTSLIAKTEKASALPLPTTTTQGANPVVSENTQPVVLDRTFKATTSKSSQAVRKRAARDHGGVLFTDAAYTDIEERDTANHLEQAQDLLVSFRNIKFSDDDEEVDVTYEKSESRRLLNENIVLRRDAEMAGKFPAKSVLGSLEPFLIDIANLPDKAPPTDVRQIKERVQKTEIVAELRSY